MTQEIREELKKIHADHQLSKITTLIADELDERKEIEKELKNRIADLEEKVE
jgi:hypothetical protein